MRWCVCVLDTKWIAGRCRLLDLLDGFTEDRHRAVESSLLLLGDGLLDRIGRVHTIALLVDLI